MVLHRYCYQPVKLVNWQHAQYLPYRHFFELSQTYLKDFLLMHVCEYTYYFSGFKLRLTYGFKTSLIISQI